MPLFNLSRRKVKPSLVRLGSSRSPVVIIDDFSGDVENVAALADCMAPFPPVNWGNYYPGVRRLISEEDSGAFAYVRKACEAIGPYLAGAFNFDEFDVIEASFSMVTVTPSQLRPVQRAPHFDSTNQNYVALLHYLRVPPGSGTAFYRQRSTGIERVTDSNVDAFVRIAKAEAADLPPASGYIHRSDDYFEQIGAVEAIPDRMVIYQGSLLHSGIIPPGMAFSADPRRGRLTANLFVQGY